MEEVSDKVFQLPSNDSAIRKLSMRLGCNEPRGKLNATNWLAHIDESSPEGIVEVMFKNTRVGFFFNPDAIPLKIGDIVTVEAAPGFDIGTVNMIGPLVANQMKKSGIKDTSSLKNVLRISTQEDLDKFNEARDREHSTMIKARAIAEELGLSMKIGDVEYQGDGGKAIFYYIADERVDFRKLIRVLADTFRIRIEMKQIGARQEAGRIGGIGPCGRNLCCSSWMNRFVSVSTGTARLQDLSMNPQKLAGQCAKLKCCINFEVDAYAEANHQMPHKDMVLETKDASYYYFKPDILNRKVTYSTDKNIPANLVTIDAKRAFEIIALNKQGIKVENLSDSEPVKEKSEFGDIIGQDSLTRFDKKKKKKKKKKVDESENKSAVSNSEAGKQNNNKPTVSSSQGVSHNNDKSSSSGLDAKKQNNVAEKGNKQNNNQQKNKPNKKNKRKNQDNKPEIKS